MTWHLDLVIMVRMVQALDSLSPERLVIGRRDCLPPLENSMHSPKSLSTTPKFRLSEGQNFLSRGDGIGIKNSAN
jgi:hypothetical protein